MAFLPQHRKTPGLPSIVVPKPERWGRPPFNVDFSSSSSPAMSIPGSDSRDDFVPPPLPPPRLLPNMEGAPYQAFPPSREHMDYMSPLSNYSSLEARYRDEQQQHQHQHQQPHHQYDFLRRSSFQHSDEGYASYASTDKSRESLPKLCLSHNSLPLHTAADVHSDCMKKKLDSVRSIPADKSPPRSLLTSSLQDSHSRRSSVDTRGQPLHLSMPTTHQLPMRGLAEPRAPSVSFPRPINPQHSPTQSVDMDRSPRSKFRRKDSDGTFASYEFTGGEDAETEETQGIKRLHIEDAYSAGQKRRAPASSPLEDLLDANRRRGGAPQRSPTPRLNTAVLSGPALASHMASPANPYFSATPINSRGLPPTNVFGQLSPSHSPGGLSPTSSHSPYATSASMHHSPKSTSKTPVPPSNPAATSPRRANEMTKPSGHKLQGFLMCECCPKKPKKFETSEELAAHEAEKQYECQYCLSRFKNKNEAERHQNSLHVRRHSWSCSAFSGFAKAFHESTARPGEADVCGYCGDEFARSGLGPGEGSLTGGIVLKHATDQDWDERFRHLQEAHKFRECNSSKKFFRADHFRQHLKHSHAGTSGKWTNVLENACMMEEDSTPR